MSKRSGKKKLNSISVLSEVHNSTSVQKIKTRQASKENIDPQLLNTRQAAVLKRLYLHSASLVFKFLIFQLKK